MEITLTQGLLLALMAFICGIDAVWEAFFIFRPIVTAFLTGVILGDIQLGLQVGAITELAYLGLTTIGGTVPPNPLVAGVMGVVIAYTAGVEPTAALGLATPFALLMQWISMFYNTAFAGFLRPLDNAAEEGDTKKFIRLVILPMFIVAATYGVLIFLSSYALQQPIANFVNAFPEWLIRGFEIAGGLLPGVGLALLLRTMLNINSFPYLIIGFVLATFLPFDGILPVAFIAIAIALIGYFNSRNNQVDTSEGGI